MDKRDVKKKEKRKKKKDLEEVPQIKASAYPAEGSSSRGDPGKVALGERARLETLWSAGLRDCGAWPGCPTGWTVVGGSPTRSDSLVPRFWGWLREVRSAPTARPGTIHPCAPATRLAVHHEVAAPRPRFGAPLSDPRGQLPTAPPGFLCGLGPRSEGPGAQLRADRQGWGAAAAPQGVQLVSGAGRACVGLETLDGLGEFQEAPRGGEPEAGPCAIAAAEARTATCADLVTTQQRFGVTAAARTSDPCRPGPPASGDPAEVWSRAPTPASRAAFGVSTGVGTSGAWRGVRRARQTSQSAWFCLRPAPRCPNPDSGSHASSKTQKENRCPHGSAPSPEVPTRSPGRPLRALG